MENPVELILCACFLAISPFLAWEKVAVSASKLAVFEAEGGGLVLPLCVLPFVSGPR